jgi:hypothetical protein
MPAKRGRPISQNTDDLVILQRRQQNAERARQFYNRRKAAQAVRRPTILEYGKFEIIIPKRNFKWNNEEKNWEEKKDEKKMEEEKKDEKKMEEEKKEEEKKDDKMNEKMEMEEDEDVWEDAEEEIEEEWKGFEDEKEEMEWEGFTD